MFKEARIAIPYLIGGKSHVNLIGKILFFPMILLILWGTCVYDLLDLLFAKKEDKE